MRTTYLVQIEVEDNEIQKVTHIQNYMLGPVGSSPSKEIEEDNDGIDTGRTHHRCWQVSEKILVLEDSE